MEILLEFLALFLQVFAEACCDGLVVVGVDALFGMSAYKARQARVRARTGGRSASADPWVWTFWILMPVALVLTALFVWSRLTARRS